MSVWYGREFEVFVEIRSAAVGLFRTRSAWICAVRRPHPRFPKWTHTHITFHCYPAAAAATVLPYRVVFLQPAPHSCFALQHFATNTYPSTFAHFLQLLTSCLPLCCCITGDNLTPHLRLHPTYMSYSLLPLVQRAVPAAATPLARNNCHGCQTVVSSAATAT